MQVLTPAEVMDFFLSRAARGDAGMSPFELELSSLCMFSHSSFCSLSRQLRLVYDTTGGTEGPTEGTHTHKISLCKINKFIIYLIRAIIIIRVKHTLLIFFSLTKINICIDL